VFGVKKAYYITRMGRLERKGNTLFFVNEEIKKGDSHQQRKRNPLL